MVDDSSPNPRKPTNCVIEAVILIVFGILTGLAAWAVGERTRNYAEVPLEISSKAYQFSELNAATVRVDSINASLVHAGLSIPMALAMTIAGLLCARGSRTPQARLVVALLAAVILGALPAFLAIPLHASAADQDPGSLDLTMPLLTHLLLWVPIGAAGGLAFGLARYDSPKQVPQTILAGALGAALGTTVYEFAGAVLLPTDKTVMPLAATAKARLWAMVCVAVGTGVGLAVSEGRKRPVVEIPASDLPRDDSGG